MKFRVWGTPKDRRGEGDWLRMLFSREPWEWDNREAAQRTADAWNAADGGETEWTVQEWPDESTETEDR